MRFLIYDTFYSPYLRKVYSCGLVEKTWKEQLEKLFSDSFGTGNAYSKGLEYLGHDALEIVGNCAPLQLTWCKEYCKELLNIANRQEQICKVLEAQVKWYKPDILYVQSINWMPSNALELIKPHVKMVIGQNASPIRPNLDLKYYDLILTACPHYISRFRSLGVNSEYFQIGFDIRLIEKYKKIPGEKYPFTFVGGLDPNFHLSRVKLLEEVASFLPISVWGYGANNLVDSSKLKINHKGEIWAGEMYKILAKSLITLNSHIDIAEDYACNMRMYEATGMGACLVTDYKSNLSTIFEPDREIITYKSNSEAISKIRNLSEDPSLAMSIGAKGQQRTIKEHNYDIRMSQLIDLIKKHIPARHKSLRGCISKTNKNVLIVCSQNNLNRVPRKLTRLKLDIKSLINIQILTDSRDIEMCPKGMACWTLLDRDKIDQLISSCFDTVSPSLVIFLHSSLENTSEFILKSKKVCDYNQFYSVTWTFND